MADVHVDSDAELARKMKNARFRFSTPALARAIGETCCAAEAAGREILAKYGDPRKTPEAQATIEACPWMEWRIMKAWPHFAEWKAVHDAAWDAAAAKHGWDGERWNV